MFVCVCVCVCVYLYSYIYMCICIYMYTGTQQWTGCAECGCSTSAGGGGAATWWGRGNWRGGAAVGAAPSLTLSLSCFMRVGFLVFGLTRSRSNCFFLVCVCVLCVCVCSDKVSRLGCKMCFFGAKCVFWCKMLLKYTCRTNLSSTSNAVEGLSGDICISRRLVRRQMLSR